VQIDLFGIKKLFIEQGFVVVPIIQLIHKIPLLLSIFDNLIEKVEYLGSKGIVRIHVSDFEDVMTKGTSWGCDHIFSPNLREQDLLDIVSLEPIPSIVRFILGEKIRWTAGHGLWSPKRCDYYLHWHRDTRRDLWIKKNSDPCCHVQVCIALRNESVIRIVPGSHIRNLEEWEYKYIEESDKHSDHPDQIIIHIPAGYAVFFNTYALHRAECLKQNVRRAIHFGFTNVDSNVQEQYRLGKSFDWLSDQNFIDVQSPFLQQCIQEEINWHKK
jgi:hypothetical protein